MKKYLTLLIAICSVFIIACNSAKLISSWVLPGATAHKYNSVLVIGLTGAKDRQIRESVESAVAKKLNEYGVTAVTASSKYGPRTFQNMSDEEAAKLVKDDGFDGIMMLALLDKNQEKNYTPGMVTRTPYAVIRSRWSRNYRVLYDRVYTPGYYTTSTNYELEANFYEAEPNELQYSAQVKAFDPGSAANLSADFSKSVIDDMVKKGILTK
ncbi:hypothetical protein [Mucilaginibacter sp. FT3.2]|uniref:hypothetical protein n=1 Tax=Mucilaginibacter sp. FT3.2 TaxID=2723090 RepID=UPI00161D85BC|nr:hypothetical protein [Mucilaginibacter sp. FT3.2]MBB6230059.1 hypothetical protein [Mucilaginibacter sp. FT3.2]